MREQRYEIWGLDETPSDRDGGESRFREDFAELDAARAALFDWQSGGRAAWIVDKPRGQMVPVSN